MYRTHIKHKFDETSQLVLFQSSNGFEVTFLTLEYAGDEDGGNLSWFSNNSQNFGGDYNEALRVFNKRRDSDSPFQPFTIDWEGIHNDIHYGSGRDF